MGFYDVLRRAADAAGVPLTHIGPAIGRGPSYVNGGMVRGSDPSTANAAAMLAACGWRLMAVPPDAVGDALAAGALAVEPPAADGDADRRALERRRERLRRELEQTERLLG